MNEDLPNSHMRPSVPGHTFPTAQQSHSLGTRVSVVAGVAAAAIVAIIALLVTVISAERVSRYGAYISKTFHATCVEVIKAQSEALQAVLNQMRRESEDSGDQTARFNTIAKRFGVGSESSFRVAQYDASGSGIRWLVGTPDANADVDLRYAGSSLLRHQSIGGLFYAVEPPSPTDRLAIVSGVPLAGNQLLMGLLSIDRAMLHLESIYAGRILITGASGNLLFGDPMLLSDSLRAKISSAKPYQTFEQNGVLYESITAPLSDLTGRTVGSIHLLKEDDGPIAAERLFERLAILVLLITLALFTAAIHGRFRAELMPLLRLERLVGALSRNEFYAPAVTAPREDEIGRMNRSIEAIRQAAIERDQLSFATTAAFSRERALIETELRKLAEMLSPGEREEVAQMLAQVREQGNTVRTSTDEPANRSLVLAFQFMSERVRAQQERVSNLLVERTADLELVRQSLAERSDLFRLREEMSVARSLQLSMLPDPRSLSAVKDRVDLQAVMRPAKEVGGDSFDFQLFDSGRRLTFLVCDSSGKGVPAAMFVLTSRALALAASAAIGRLDIALKVSNAALARTNDALAFTTMFIGSLDLDTGVLTYSNAGHNPPVLIRASGERERLDQAVGLVLGAMDDATYEEAQAHLQPGDTLVLYTDGVTEAHDQSDRMFGLDRLEDACQHLHAEAPALIIERLLEQVDQFSGDRLQYDDITLMAIRYGATTGLPSRAPSLSGTGGPPA